MSIQAMKQALEAILQFRNEPMLEHLIKLRATDGYVALDVSMDALRAAIEAAEKQEPVAWMGEYNINDIRDHYTVVMRHKTDFSSMPDRVRPLYTHPQPAIPEWQPIETAPRDGTYFICFNGNWRGLSRYWEPNYEDDPIWVDETTEFISPPPTHWMPLPAAPEVPK